MSSVIVEISPAPFSLCKITQGWLSYLASIESYTSKAFFHNLSLPYLSTYLSCYTINVCWLSYLLPSLYLSILETQSSGANLFMFRINFKIDFFKHFILSFYKFPCIHYHNYNSPTSYKLLSQLFSFQNLCNWKYDCWITVSSST